MALPAFIAAGAFSSIVGFIIRAVVGTLIARFVLSLGISVLTYQGIDSILSTVKSHFIALMNSVGSGVAVDIATSLGLVQAANIIFSAYIGAYGIRFALGAFKRLTFGNFADS